MGFFFGKRLFSLPENTFLRKTWLSEAPTRLFSEKIGFRDSRQGFFLKKSGFGTPDGTFWGKNRLSGLPKGLLMRKM